MGRVLGKGEDEEEKCSLPTSQWRMVSASVLRIGLQCNLVVV